MVSFEPFESVVQQIPRNTHYPAAERYMIDCFRFSRKLKHSLIIIKSFNWQLLAFTSLALVRESFATPKFDSPNVSHLLLYMADIVYSYPHSFMILSGSKTEQVAMKRRKETVKAG